MTRVLIAFKDNAQCMQFGFGLTTKKRSVEVATTAAEVVKTGLHYRPDILIVGATLADSVSGFLASEAITAVHETTKTIMVVDEATEHLKNAAREAKILCLVQMPVGADKMAILVDKAANAAVRPNGLPIGLVEYEKGGRVRWANPLARRMLGLSPNGLPESRLSTLLSNRSLFDLEHSDKEWIQVSSAERLQYDFHGFVRNFDNTNFLFLIEPTYESLKHSDPVQLLTGQEGAGAVIGPIQQRVLLVESNCLQRRIAASQLQRIHCRFHTAENLDRALAIMSRDPLVEVVLLDCMVCENCPDEAVQALRNAKPDITIVGTSTSRVKQAFDGCSVDLLLTKPFLADSLVRLLEEKNAKRAATPAAPS